MTSDEVRMLILPVQDGNGRVGRLVALKECLMHNVIPFTIEDAGKYFYFRGLSGWKKGSLSRYGGSTHFFLYF